MTTVVSWYEIVVGGIPLQVLEVWGRFAYIVGFILAVCAFGGFTFRIGDRWGFGRARQGWDTKAFLSIPLTSVLVIATSYIGSFIVLVPGAQTFESLKDLAVLLSIVLFGYPALIAIPPAYMLSDLMEGVPPDFVLNWAEGYFFWTAFVWMAYQLIGRNPDFRLVGTWARYSAFVALIMFFDPVMWGFICSGKFTSAISYKHITSALAFTLTVTWLLGPLAFLLAFPLAKRFGWFWAEIPGRVKERAIRSTEWAWESGFGQRPDGDPRHEGLPIRIFIFTPFIALVLAMVGVTAIVALQNADDDAAMLVTKLHQQTSANTLLRLDDYLTNSPSPLDTEHKGALASLLRDQTISTNGRTFILNTNGKIIASSAPDGDAVVENAVTSLARHTTSRSLSAEAAQFQFDHVTAKPLSHETWWAYATRYSGASTERGWTVVTAMPESFFLAGLRRANSRSAMVFALALVLSLVLAAVLASIVTAPLRNIARATQAVAAGKMNVRVPGSKLEELGTLANSFNDMARKLKAAFDDLLDEIETRKYRERELAQSQARLRASEERWRSVFETSTLGIILADENLRILETNRALQEMLGYSAQELKDLPPVDLIADDEREAWLRRAAELRDGKRPNYEVTTRYRRKDRSQIWVNTFVSTIPSDKKDPPLYFATAIDITDRYKAERELRRLATYLAEAEKVSHTGCWARNIDTGEQFWSEEQWRIFGLDPRPTPPSYDEFLDMIHPDDRDDVEKNIERAVRNKRPYNFSFRTVLRDDTIKHLRIVGRPVSDESAVSEYLGVTIDETERVRANVAMIEAEAELTRVARLTTMGELTASIAHEINQPLAAVVANGNAALRWLTRTRPDLEEAKQALKAIVSEGNRASQVIGRVRTLLKHRQPEYAGLDVNDAIQDVLSLTANTLRSRNVTVHTELLDELPPALGDRVQLQQVIMNLILNATDAMSPVLDRPRVLRIGSQVDETGNVMISIRDSGIGIDETIRERIFTPLFSTKPTGMGMGLSICRTIVEAHGGRLWASAATPYGTDFRFAIPPATASQGNEA
jgi:PAS domain S-box-containing protein